MRSMVGGLVLVLLLAGGFAFASAYIALDGVRESLE